MVFPGHQEIIQIILILLIYIGYFLEFQIKLLLIPLMILYLQKLISKYNLVLDFESPLGKSYVDSNFKSKAKSIKQKLIRQLEIIE